MKLAIPELSLVLLIGASGSGKSTFAHEHFKPTEILSSDFCRGLVSDDENDQSVNADAFAVLHFIAAKRLAHGKLTVVDATNVQSEARRPLIALARQHHYMLVAIVLDMPEKLCWARTQTRPDRNFGRHVIRGHREQLRRSLKQLKREGFRHIYHLRSVEELEAVVIERKPLWTNLKHEHGPFDIIGDVHGCGDELEALLSELGYEFDSTAAVYRHPQGRTAIFLGDLVDRGPRILDAYQIVRRMVEAGQAFCLPGNHDMKLVRKLNGKNVQITHGLDKTLAELEALPREIREQYEKEMVEFFRSLISHYVLDDGKLVVAHAGMKERMQGRASAKVRDFALFGETTGGPCPSRLRVLLICGNAG
jgi:protein phosphatase